MHKELVSCARKYYVPMHRNWAYMWCIWVHNYTKLNSCAWTVLWPQGPAEKRIRVEALQPHENGSGAGTHIVQREHPHPQRVSQPHEGNTEHMEPYVVQPHMSQVPTSRAPWQSSQQSSHRESIPDATIGDPAYANIGDQVYIPNGHQQPMGQSYPGSQSYPQSWQDAQYTAPQWELDSRGYPIQRGGPWRGEQSLARIPSGGYPSQPARPPIVMSGPPQIRHPMEFDGRRDAVFVDHNGNLFQPVQRRGFYDEGERLGYERVPVGYNNSQAVGVVAPLQVVAPNMGGSYPMHAPGQMLVAASGGDGPARFPAPSAQNVTSSESFNPENAINRDSSHPQDSMNSVEAPNSDSSARKQRRDAQHVYEADEADRKARGLKPHVIECDSLGEPVDSGRNGSRFLEVLKALCTIYLDVSIIKVVAQDPHDYASLRAEVETEFEFTGHPISDYGFKKAVSKCMKAERSRLHKLYLTKPARECPPREEPHMWERLKIYWQSPEFEKVSKVGTFVLFCI